jgi:hypothetical protein
MSLTDFSTDSFASMIKQDPYADAGQIRVEFYMRPCLDRKASQKEQRAIYVEKEYLKIFTPGAVKYSIVDRPVWPVDKARFKNQYAAWKSGKAQPRIGTPLAALAGTWISLAQVEEMRFFQIHTVEELANMSDGIAQQFMGIHSLRQAAKDFLGSGEATKKALAEKDEQIATMQKALEEMNARVAQIESQKRR